MPQGFAGGFESADARRRDWISEEHVLKSECSIQQARMGRDVTGTVEAFAESGAWECQVGSVNSRRRGLTIGRKRMRVDF